MNVKILFYKQYWWDLWYSIKCFFNPSQSWLTKYISNEYMSEAELIDLVFEKSIVHFVDNIIDENYTGEKDEEIIEIYKFYKYQKPEIEKEIKELHEKTYISYDERIKPLDDGNFEFLSLEDSGYPELQKYYDLAIKKQEELDILIQKYQKKIIDLKFFLYF